jgi:hypothetical protein
MRRVAARAVVAHIALAVLAASCAPDGDRSEPPATSPATPPRAVQPAADGRVLEHPITDLDGDGHSDIVRLEAHGSRGGTRLGLRFSGGASCEELSPVPASAKPRDLVDADDLDGDGRPELWVALDSNSGERVGLARLDGCTLQYLAEPGSDRPFGAWTNVHGHLCCPDAAASVRCLTRWGTTYVVTTEVFPERHPARTPEISPDELPYAWSRRVLRVAGDRVVTVTSDGGRYERRGLVPAGIATSGLDCA